MGNEVSSVKVHSLLTAEDLKQLRTQFPGGGSGTPPTSLSWGVWREIVPEDLLKGVEKVLTTGGGKQSPDHGKELTFHNYQELAGCVVRGTTEERTKLIFQVVPKDSANKIKASDLLSFVTDIATAFSHVYMKSHSESCSIAFGQSALHDLCFPKNESKKNFLRKDPADDPDLDFDTVERWMAMTFPLFDRIYQFVMAKSFGLASSNRFIPNDFYQLAKCSRLLPLEIAFLDSNLPPQHKQKWRPLFNSRTDGESFAKLTAAILDNGPTVIVVWEEDGHIFGGFASHSWALGPKFFGDNTCFLFNLRPRMYVYESTPFNDHFLYMNTKQKTMPNGLGMGGQLEYFGLWIDSEYGKARCAPSCTTYASPQLSKEEFFHFSHVEVYAVGDKPEKEDDGNTRSVLDRDPEAQAVMEMMGKTFISKDVRAADKQTEKELKQQLQQQQEKDPAAAAATSTS